MIRKEPSADSEASVNYILAPASRSLKMETNGHIFSLDPVKDMFQQIMLLQARLIEESLPKR